MFNVCPQCGMYSEAKTIDPDGPFAICRHCGYAHPFKRLPLFVVTGASASGKSAACLQLAPILPECVVLECDLFWRREFDTPDTNYREFRNLCLRVAKNIGQAGRPIVLCGSSIPEQYEGCPERIYFSAMHTAALVCDDKILRQRLVDRPPWRDSSKPMSVQKQIEFNHWFKTHAAQIQPPITLLDTSRASVVSTAGQIAGWVRQQLLSTD